MSKTATELLKMEHERQSLVMDAAKKFVDGLVLPENFSGDCSFEIVDRVGKYTMVNTINRKRGKFYLTSFFGEEVEL